MWLIKYNFHWTECVAEVVQHRFIGHRSQRFMFDLLHLMCTLSALCNTKTNRTNNQRWTNSHVLANSAEKCQASERTRARATEVKFDWRFQTFDIDFISTWHWIILVWTWAREHISSIKNKAIPRWKIRLFPSNIVIFARAYENNG